MKKRFLSLIMVLALVFAYSAAVPCSAAESTTIDGLTYEYDTQTGKAAVIDHSDSLSGDVDIPETISVDGTDYDVTSIGARAFDYCDSLESVTIPSSVSSIGARAFVSCTGLKSVTIPSSVTSIGDRAFVSCTGLKSVTIPSSVTSIGNYAFSACTGLESVTIPSSVTFGGGAFYNCTGLTGVTIQEGVSSIGDQMFNGCTGLKSVTIPSSVTSIGNGAFANCTGITGIDIPSSVTSIGTSAFIDCTGLTDVTIQEGVSSIGDRAFYGCTGITGIDIPSSVTSIGGIAFYGCTGLTDVTIQEGVSSIGNSAFWSCTGLKSVTIPSSVSSIGASAFYGCTGLTDVTIQEGVSSIGDQMFNGCTGLESVTIPSSVTSIGNGAFRSCTGLESVTIPGSVKSIGPNAFRDCTGLTDIDIPSSVSSIGDYAFDNCTGLESVTIPSSVTSIGISAFRDCTGLTDIFIPDGLDLRTDQFYNINPNVWHYEVLEKADDSADGKIHVAITSVTDKNGENITLSDPVVFQDNAMGDIYVIDKVDIENVSLEHKLTKTGAKEPTCTEDGNIEYWTCEGCGRYFSDAEGKREIKLADTILEATGHSMIKTEAVEPTCTEDGNIEYYQCETCGKYFSDENGSNEITSESTILKATGHSYENGRCTVCSAIDPDFEPVIIDGANGEWTKGTKEGLSFTSNAAFADFLKVMVDGNDLDASDYTVKEGSTIVTLDADYLETLSEGEHEIAIVSDTGTAAAKFTVNAATAEDSDDTAKTEETSAAETADDTAKTGDDFDIALFAILAVLAAAGAVYTGKKKYNK